MIKFKKRTFKTTCLVISILCFLSCKMDNKTESLHLEKPKSDKIDSLAIRFLELNRFSGTILVAKYGTIIYNQSFGFADYDNKMPFSSKTAFKIGEITEIITQSIVNGLVEKGKVKLTDKLSKHLSEIESDITIGDLINDNSHIDYNTVGRLIEKVSNKSYQENIDEYSTDLKLENTYFQKKDPFSAVGYLYHNYRGEGLELQKSPTYNLEDVFSSKGLKSTGSDLIKILKSNPKELNVDGYLDNDGFSYALINDTKNSISIIVLSNRRHPVAKEICNSIKSILHDDEYRLPLLREPFDVDKTILKDYSGSYTLNQNISFDVQDSNDSLFVLMGPNKTYLIPQSSNQFYMEDVDASMRFLRDSTGIVNSIVLLNGFIDSEQIAKRIK